MKENMTEEMKKFIVERVDRMGKCWKTIADEFNEEFPKCSLTRCYLNNVYENYLDPKCNNMMWSKQEEIRLMNYIGEQLSKYGTTLNIFSKLKTAEFPGRSRNDIKNKYYTKFREFLYQIVNEREDLGESEHYDKMIKHVKLVIGIYRKRKLSVHSHLYSIINKYKASLPPPLESIKRMKLAIEDLISPKEREVILDTRFLHHPEVHTPQNNHLTPQTNGLIIATADPIDSIDNILPTPHINYINSAAESSKTNLEEQKKIITSIADTANTIISKQNEGNLHLHIKQEEIQEPQVIVRQNLQNPLYKIATPDPYYQQQPTIYFSPSFNPYMYIPTLHNYPLTTDFRRYNAPLQLSPMQGYSNYPIYRK